MRIAYLSAAKRQSTQGRTMMKRSFATAAVLIAAAVTLVACGHRQPYQDRPGPGWITLFDGTRDSFDKNWTRVGDANWRFEYGNIVADRRTSKASSTLVSKNSYTDFHLRVEFWVSHGADSGIYIRCSNVKKITADTGYQVNIYDTRPDPRYGTGGIINVATVNPMPKVDGRWSVMEITAKGNRLTVWVNGTLTVDVLDSKFKSGPIGLQYVNGAIKWRKVQIRPIG
jgi:hypothetical protein